MDEDTHRCCQHRACVDGDLHEFVHHLKGASREGLSTMVATQIGIGLILPAVVGADEMVGDDDSDPGDKLVLDKYKEGGWAARLG